jgi:hypothetical protein
MMLFAVSIPAVMYMIYVFAVPLIILAVLFGLRWKVGMWGNFLSLGAVLFSILIAIGWWEDVAELIAKQAPQTLFIADCLAVWILFLVSLAVIDAVTRFISKVNVKYNDTVEKVGNGIVLFMLFVSLYGFSIFANGHLGMVGEHPNAAACNSAPATVAINLVTILSTGNLSCFSETKEFDPDGKLRERHLHRRQAIMLTRYGESDPPLPWAENDMIGKMQR